jgi:hypothetical protein
MKGALIGRFRPVPCSRPTRVSPGTIRTTRGKEARSPSPIWDKPAFSPARIHGPGALSGLRRAKGLQVDFLSPNLRALSAAQKSTRRRIQRPHLKSGLTHFLTPSPAWGRLGAPDWSSRLIWRSGTLQVTVSAQVNRRHMKIGFAIRPA